MLLSIALSRNSQLESTDNLSSYEKVQEY